MNKINKEATSEMSLSKKIFGVVAATALVFTLSACSGSTEEENVDSTATEQTTEETTPTPAETRDTAPIVAGSVESVKVEDLSDACATAIEPIRVIMGKYKSGLLISQPYSDAISKAATKAVEECSAEEFKKFEDQEFTGWNNAKTE